MRPPRESRKASQDARRFIRRLSSDSSESAFSPYNNVELRLGQNDNFSLSQTSVLPKFALGVFARAKKIVRLSAASFNEIPSMSRVSRWTSIVYYWLFFISETLSR